MRKCAFSFLFAALLLAAAMAGPTHAETPTCENGVVVADPWADSRLVADCNVLLGARATLADEAILNWDAGIPITAWDGVAIAGNPSRVRTLDLPRRGLTGRIPPELAGLDALWRLDLSFNELTGPIPAALGDLGSLRYLWLHQNRLSGSIPATLGSLSDLWSLALSNNQLSGPIPASLGFLSELRSLWLQSNALSGPIPAELGALFALRNLALSHNQLSGAIPTELGFPPALTTLYLRSNDLSGPIPLRLAELRELAYLELGRNPGLTGCVPPPLRYGPGNDLGRLLLPDCPPPPPTRCANGTAVASPADPTCIRAVYRGAPEDYADVADIPDAAIIEPDEQGRYRVQRGQQVTVVTTALLPPGFADFALERRPVAGPAPTSGDRAVPRRGTTYTFTPIPFEGAADVITFDLRAVRTGPRPAEGHVMVSTTFQVVTPAPPLTPTEVSLSALGGEPFSPGTYSFVIPTTPRLPALILQIPTSEHQVKWTSLQVGSGGMAICLTDSTEESEICFSLHDGRAYYSDIVDSSDNAASVTISDVFDYIAASARMGEIPERPPPRCTRPTDPTCIRVVYRGAPEDYADVADIPDAAIIQPDEQGRYHVRRGQQVTVVTTARLPSYYNAFELERRPAGGPAPTSGDRAVPPRGTTYTFTPIRFEGAADVITFDLRQVRTGAYPAEGDVVVTTTFQVVTPAPGPVWPEPDLGGEPMSPGTYVFHSRTTGSEDVPPFIIDIPTSDHQIKWSGSVLSSAGGSICLSDVTGESELCLSMETGEEWGRRVAASSGATTSVTISDVFDYIAASARMGEVQE